MAERKINKIRKTSSVGKKQTDQLLSGAGLSPALRKESKENTHNSDNLNLNIQPEVKASAGTKGRKKQPAQRASEQKSRKTRQTKANSKISDQIEKIIGSLTLPELNTEAQDVKALQPKTTRRRSSPREDTKTSQRSASSQRRTTQDRRKSGRKPAPAVSVKAYFLGGLNEIGKNFTVFECLDDLIIVDCGLSFPDEDMPGIDVVIPDFSFVESNAARIKGLFITHGHEDHIGAVPYLLKKLNIPVFGTALTLGLVEAKLREFGLDKTADLRVYPSGSRIKAGCFDVEFIHVNHSVADAVALALHTPAGVIIHTGDFKIDYTPTEGEVTDLARFAQLGSEGVLALFADSTNAERPGYTQTEQKVNDTLDAMFLRAGKKRIIVATFASSISRVQMIINCAVKYGRKVALSGRSMVNVVNIASTLGYMKVPEGLLIDLSQINKYTDEEIVLITTGSQGEPLSALSRMAYAEHRQVEVGGNDFIIISARPIPGNEKLIGNVVDALLKKNAEVIYESMYDLHVSGHACQEELKLIHFLTKPKYFVPVHGETKHLKKHAQLAVSLGMPMENIFIGDIGNCIEINRDFIKKAEDVQAGSILVDGIGVGDVGNVVLKDRKLLAEDGLIIAVCIIDSLDGHVVSGPDIVSRGFVYVRESEEMMNKARAIVRDTVDGCADKNIKEWNTIKTKVKEQLSRYLYEQTKRTPMILPILMEV